MLKQLGSARFLRLASGGIVVTFPTGALRMILPVEALLSVPRMRAGVEGIVVHENRAIPIFSLAALVTLPDVQTATRIVATSIAVVEQEGALAGFLVESIEPASMRPHESDGISDGIRLLATAGIFTDPSGDEPAAHAASGAI